MTDFLNVANNYSTELAENVLSDSTSFEVGNIPENLEPPFRVTISVDQDYASGEVIEVTAVDGNTFTSVSRGLEDTDAQDWNEGAIVSLFYTAGLHEQIIDGIEIAKEEAEIGEGDIERFHLQDEIINRDKIEDREITAIKIAKGAIGQEELGENSVSNANIIAGQITEAKMNWKQHLLF